MVAGLDECGVGSLAGPVVAGACILSPDFNLQVGSKSSVLKVRSSLHCAGLLSRKNFMVPPCEMCGWEDLQLILCCGGRCLILDVICVFSFCSSGCEGQQATLEKQKRVLVSAFCEWERGICNVS